MLLNDDAAGDVAYRVSADYLLSTTAPRVLEPVIRLIKFGAGGY